ncbi:unnamed protein product [Candida verbasci]|uniref:Glutathione hydrolase n=1 Tax=Candida verbasci TaxID=1227364 RepID=A0A9W4TYS3_9ASCO|nr:unnamed protein product [Candida verbasci]
MVKQEHQKTRKLLMTILVLIPTFILIAISLYNYNQHSFFRVNISNLSRSDPYLSIQIDDPLSDKIGQPTLKPNKDHLHIGSTAMVSSDVPICSTMGKNILLNGGNAADAAVTVALCIGSINSHSSGIGGGAFILSKHGDDIISIDAREMAPINSDKEMYDNAIYSKIGGLAIAVPGELKGLYELFQLHGSGNLSWKELIQPVIELNEKGWKCSRIFEAVTAKEHDLVLSKVPLLKSLWDDFLYSKNGQPVQEGDWLNRKNYANTLMMIANNGSSDIFYDPEGPIVRSLIQTVRNWGGVIVPKDFENYHTVIEKALSLDIGNYTIYTSNGVSSGLSLLGGLKFFSRIFNKSDSDYLYSHKLIESFKWLSSIRTRLGDSSDQSKNIDHYLSDQWIDDIFEQGNYSDSHTFEYPNYNPLYCFKNITGTSHFSIVDKDNNAVSLTTTINLLFGSLIIDKTTGIILNDQMDDFATNFSNAFNLTPSMYNGIIPGKRPLSSTAPTIILKDGIVDFVIGAAGGSRITTAILQAIIRIYYIGFNLLDAIAFPRLHHQLIPQGIMCENLTVYNEEIKGIEKELSSMGHDFIETGSLTAMNGIKRAKDGSLHGVADYWRKRGEADGY